MTLALAPTYFDPARGSGFPGGHEVDRKHAPYAGQAGPCAITPDQSSALRELQAGYWALVDGRERGNPAELFTADAVFELGTLRLSGRAQIDEFFRSREAVALRDGRVTRHLPSDVRLRALAADRVVATSTVIVMAGHGPLPIASVLPSIGDFEDLCVREADACWRFAHRRATSVFAGPEAPGFARSAGPQEG